MSMVVAGLLVLLYLIWGAIEWITAGGESAKIAEARQKIVQSVIGIIVLASTVAIYTMVQSFLGFKALDFESNSTSPSTRFIRNTAPQDESSKSKRTTPLEDRISR